MYYSHAFEFLLSGITLIRSCVTEVAQLIGGGGGPRAVCFASLALLNSRRALLGGARQIVVSARVLAVAVTADHHRHYCAGAKRSSGSGRVRSTRRALCSEVREVRLTCLSSRHLSLVATRLSLVATHLSLIATTASRRDPALSCSQEGPRQAVLC